MHEYSVAAALIELAERLARRHRALAVRGLEVALGELSGVDAGLLETAYGVVREGTPCAEAALRLRRIEAVWKCRACGRRVDGGRALLCPGCNGPAALASGDELLLERIEMEVA
jgi:hydrogenase nickel incorporation protein HypA/HybF